MLATLVVCVAISFVVSLRNYDLFPLTGYFVWLLLGMVLLRFGPLLVLVVAVSLAVIGAILDVGPLTGARASAAIIFAVSAALVLYVSSRQRSGLPGPLSEALLADLRDRLNAQGSVPPLPAGWSCETAMVAAYGVGYAGDFMVADLDEQEQRLDLVLVDVVGKGVKAAPSALLLAGALGGMVGACAGPSCSRPPTTSCSARTPTRRSRPPCTSASTSGAGSTRSSARDTRRPCTGTPWPDGGCSTGRAVSPWASCPDPELDGSHGVLQPGEALLFYTDGVVESPGDDIDDGITWLQETAAAAFAKGADGAARRVIRQVPRGDDDRALLILSRTAA